jgi:hypothetical protein
MLHKMFCCQRDMKDPQIETVPVNPSQLLKAANLDLDSTIFTSANCSPGILEVRPLPPSIPETQN